MKKVKSKYFSPRLLNNMRCKGKRLSCECKSGHKHASRLEAGHCDVISLMHGIKEVKRQVNFDLVVNGVKICRHIPDFLITWQSGKVQVIESKGFPTSEWNLKMKLFKALFPDITYTVWTK